MNGAPFEYGERIDAASTHPRLLAEHLARYRFAAAHVSGRRVLDIASGTGYGAVILERRGASLIVQIEIDPAAVRLARERAPARTCVIRGDAHALPLCDGCVDACVCFETVEHLRDPRAFVAELGRVMVPGGVLVLSTPDRRSSLIPHDNPFHHREFDRAEVLELLATCFTVREWAGQYVQRGGPRDAARRWLVSSPVARALRATIPRRLRALLGRVAAGSADVIPLGPDLPLAATILAVAERR